MLRYYDTPDHKPPCEQSGVTCPKGHWSKASQYELTDQNWRTWQLYQRVQATSGACLTETERADELLMQNLAQLDLIYRQWANANIAHELARVIFTAQHNGKR